jgi:L-histidine Nalpha-methyltransferase
MSSHRQRCDSGNRQTDKGSLDVKSVSSGGATHAASALSFFYDDQSDSGDFRADVLEGLRREPKSLPAKYLYDRRGSALFEAITQMPQYYIPNAENALLTQAGPRLRDAIGPDAAIIELGAGALVKVRLLMDALDHPHSFAALDISGEHLRAALEPLARNYSHLKVGGLQADFTQGIDWPHAMREAPGKRVVFFPGSTLGNMTRATQRTLLVNSRAMLRRGDFFLLGVDLVKPRDLVLPAYDDPAGITAQFILNILHHIRDGLGAEVDTEAYDYRCRWNEICGQVEMNIRATTDTRIVIDGQVIGVQNGEEIAISRSRKYTPQALYSLCSECGFRPALDFTDTRHHFLVSLFVAD